MHKRLLAAAFALAVTACQPQARDGSSASPPADTRPTAPAAAAPAGQVMDLSEPLLARGNEPFWAVRIDGTRFTLQRPGEPDKLFEAPGAQVTPGRAAWQARSADGQTLAITLYASDCGDGMSDLRYPMTAEIILLGQTLNGCAAKVSQLPREGAMPR